MWEVAQVKDFMSMLVSASTLLLGSYRFMIMIWKMVYAYYFRIEFKP